MTIGRLARSLPTEAWFLAAGLLSLPVIRVRGASAAVHLGLFAAVCALFVVGAWLERFVFSLQTATPAPVHRIVLGQAGLLVYFYARSALAQATGIPGVSRWELCLLAVAAGAHLWLRREPREPAAAARTAAYGVVWLFWWASTWTYLGYRSGRLEPPASDPDFHALLARLTAEHGYLVHDLLPSLAQTSSYPSGFSALNAIWIGLSGANPVTVVNCQIALQACLAVGLVLEMVFALRRGPALGISLLLVALAHFVFSFPVNAAMAYLEGSPRLAHKAFAILPLTAAVRLSDAQGGRAGRAAWMIAAFCVAWAAALNPAHLFVEAPIALAGLLLVRGPLARSWRAAFAGAALAALLLLTDAWYGPRLRALFEAGGATAPIALHWGQALRAGLDSAGAATLAHALPYRCIASAQCPPLAAELGAVLVLPLVALAILAVLFGRTPDASRRSARAVLAIALALWGSAFLAGFVPALFAAAPGLEGSLLQSYSSNGLVFSTSLLYFALLAATLAFAAELAAWAFSERRPLRGVDADLAVGTAAALACAAIVAMQPAVLQELSDRLGRNVRRAPLTALGSIGPEDVRMARAAARFVAPGDKVLLPGVVKVMNQWETWYFTLGGARAIPLYSDVGAAFFHAGSGDPSAADYRDHVCDRLDLAWLASRRIVWLYESATVAGWACIHAWPQARDRYFELTLRDGSASLWRLRTDLIAQARGDPLLAR